MCLHLTFLIHFHLDYKILRHFIFFRCSVSIRIRLMMNHYRDENISNSTVNNYYVNN